MKTLYTALVLLSAILVSCSGVKGLQEPHLDLPSSYVGGVAEDSLSIADMDWWEFYADGPLRQIIRRTLENNRDVLKAAARVEEMRQLYGVEKLNLYPEVSGLISADNETNDYYNGGGYSSDPEFALKVSVGWEVNLWGAMTWARRQGAARYRASVEDLRAMRMTLIAEVATAYFRLAALDNELSIVRQTLQTRSESLVCALRAVSLPRQSTSRPR